MTALIAIINGPNLNLLGTREPELYGTESLESIIGRLTRRIHEAGYRSSHFQSNSEGAIIDHIHALGLEKKGIALFNPGAYTHTSLALRDAVLAVRLAFIEVHLSNPARRESVRTHSHFTDLAIGLVSGFGPLSYDLALEAALQFLHQPTSFPREAPHGHT